MKMLYKPLKIFFIGIGGVSMSALALYCNCCGFAVSGSDKSESIYVENLRKNNIQVYVGHDENNLKNIDVVVYNSAISEDNAELKYAKENKLALFSRAEFLQWIISTFKKSVGICGCHGKTTATCMLTHVLKNAHYDVCMHVGGRDVEYGNFIYGKDIIVTEVCEFKKNITYITTEVAVALNIDNDHLDSYRNIGELKEIYFDYLDRAKIAVVNNDDKFLHEYGGRKISFGIDNQADVNAIDVVEDKGYYTFAVKVHGDILPSKFTVFGRHNVYNALSAVCVANYYRVPIVDVIRGFQNFKGVERRFEFIGKVGEVEVIADYCHHPKEIEASLNLADSISKNYAVIFQPHTYSRTRILFDEFVEVFSHVKNLSIYTTYSAREKYEWSGCAERLSKELGCNYIDTVYKLQLFLSSVENIDKLFIFGAGDIYDIVKDFINKKTP